MHPLLPQATPSDAPVLLLSGEFDPITPPRYAERAARGYRNSRLLVAAGQGHGVVARGCVPLLISDFIDHADPAALEAGCLERLAPDAFFVNLLGPPP
jgi:pimeloyl-ACP methyl ester carboxylesterase